ncbi:MAG: carbohydrate ABC transporter permease [bacterium]
MKQESRIALKFIAPALTFLAVFIVIPILATILTSLFRNVPYLATKFLAFGNYRRIIADRQFWQSMKFTMGFVAFCIPMELALGLGFALLLNERFRFRAVMRIVVLIPWAIPTIVAARTWQLIYNYSYGLANHLVSWLGISSQPISWLGSPGSAFLALAIADIWKTTPFAAIIILAGLQTIPEEIYEHAKIDGANIFNRFKLITLPLLRPALLVVLLFRTIDTIRIMDLIYVVTGGGPGGSTTSLSLLGLKYFNEGDFGYGSTVAVIVFAIAMALSIAYVKIMAFQWTRHE